MSITAKSENNKDFIFNLDIRSNLELADLWKGLEALFGFFGIELPEELSQDIDVAFVNDKIQDFSDLVKADIEAGFDKKPEAFKEKLDTHLDNFAKVLDIPEEEIKNLKEKLHQMAPEKVSQIMFGELHGIDTVIERLEDAGYDPNEPDNEVENEVHEDNTPVPTRVIENSNVVYSDPVPLKQSEFIEAMGFGKIDSISIKSMDEDGNYSDPNIEVQTKEILNSVNPDGGDVYVRMVFNEDHEVTGMVIHAPDDVRIGDSFYTGKGFYFDPVDEGNIENMPQALLDRISKPSFDTPKLKSEGLAIQPSEDPKADDNAFYKIEAQGLKFEAGLN